MTRSAATTSRWPPIRSSCRLTSTPRRLPMTRHGQRMRRSSGRCSPAAASWPSGPRPPSRCRRRRSCLLRSPGRSWATSGSIDERVFGTARPARHCRRPGVSSRRPPLGIARPAAFCRLATHEPTRGECVCAVRGMAFPPAPTREPCGLAAVSAPSESHYMFLHAWIPIVSERLPFLTAASSRRGPPGSRLAVIAAGDAAWCSPRPALPVRSPPFPGPDDQGGMLMPMVSITNFDDLQIPTSAARLGHVQPRPHAGTATARGVESRATGLRRPPPGGRTSARRPASAAPRRPTRATATSSITSMASCSPMLAARGRNAYRPAIRWASGSRASHRRSSRAFNYAATRPLGSGVRERRVTRCSGTARCGTTTSRCRPRPRERPHGRVRDLHREHAVHRNHRLRPVRLGRHRCHRQSQLHAGQPRPTPGRCRRCRSRRRSAWWRSPAWPPRAFLRRRRVRA